MADELPWLLVQLVECGFPVLPCTPGQKMPATFLVPRGFLDATTDLEVVARWVEACPGANWAVRTGPLTEGPWSGHYFAVVDIDDAQLAEQICQVASTTITQTPWGGVHLWVISPRPVANAKLHANGRVVGDLKAATPAGAPGGYVLVAGRTADPPGEYQLNWGPGPLVVDDVWAWLRSLVSTVGVAIDLPHPLAERVLRGQRLREGERHSGLVSLAALAASRGLDQAAILTTLRVARDGLCEAGTHPVDDDEIAAIAKWAAARVPPHQDRGLAYELAVHLEAETAFARDRGDRLYIFTAGVYKPQGEDFVRQRVRILLELWGRTARFSQYLLRTVVELILARAPPPLGGAAARRY